jgi:hypothetical protein
VAFVQEAIPFMAGEEKEVSSGLSAELGRVGLLEEYRMLHGRFAYHYVIFFRHILAEDTLLAMNEGGERYSMSLFTFEGPRSREGYYAACGVLARAFARLYLPPSGRRRSGTGATASSSTASRVSSASSGSAARRTSRSRACSPPPCAW